MPHLGFRPSTGRGRRRLPIAALIAGLALIPAVLAGCRSSSKGSPSTPSPSPPTAGAAASPTAAAASTPAPIDPSSVTLQTDPGAQDAYTIQIPVAWQAENIPAPGGFGRRYTLFDNATRTAQVTVRCQQGATVDSLSRADSGVVGSLGGTYAVSGMTDVTLGGMQGQATEYRLSVGGQAQETRVLYLQGKICGWQILLQAFGGGQLIRYTPLFELILATFRPAVAGG